MAMNPRLLRPTPSGFDPRRIAGLALWLDASDTSTITVDQGAQEWRDKSGRGKHFVQNTGNNQPATGTETINGRNVLRFDGSDDFMTATDAFFTGTGLPFSLFIVQRIVGITTFGMSYTTTQSGTNGFEVRQQSGTGIMQVAIGGTGTVVANFPNSSVGVDDLIAVIFPSTGNNLFYQRGTQLSVVTTLKPGTDTATHTIGRRSGSTFPANVRIAEIIAYNAQVNDNERKAIEQYLGRKWGITVA